MIYVAILYTFVVSVYLNIKIDKLKYEHDDIMRHHAILTYRINSLIREIDYHLHVENDQLSNSYFANCREVRESYNKKDADSYMIWGSK